MKKKVLFIGLCLFSLLGFSGVKAETRACTEDEVKNARATLQLNTIGVIPVPTLGRQGNNRAYIYKMSLTNQSTNKSNTSFCLDNGKVANTGLVYKIKYEVTNPDWKLAYNYGIQRKDSNSYVMAQAALWMLRENISWDLKETDIYSSNLFRVAKDIELNLNCETYLQMYFSSKVSKAYCETYKKQVNSTEKIEKVLFNKWSQNNSGTWSEFLNSLFGASIQPVYMDFYSYVKSSGEPYPGKLYLWEEANGGNYQTMLAPLQCTGDTGDDNPNPTPTQRTCTDSRGRVHDYTERYNTCKSNGESSESCIASLENELCPDSSQRYTIIRRGWDAVCESTSTNIGSMREEVIESDEGTAIPNKGDNQLRINSYCNLYCLENSANQIFPGNVRPAVSAGTYIIWPTSESTISSKYKNQYPLRFSGQKTCYVVMAGEESTVNRTNIDAAYNTLSGAIDPNKRDNEFAHHTYEYIRTNGGCDDLYNTYCQPAQIDVNNKCSSWNSVKEEYDSLVSAANSRKAACDNEKASLNTAMNTACNNDPTSSECNKATREYNNKGCSDNPIDFLNNYERSNYNDYSGKMRACSDANDKLGKCNDQKTACNTYTTAVNKLIDFANQIKTCATYTPDCSGSSCGIYNFETNVDLSWGDPEYGTTITDAQLEKSKNYSYSVINDTSIDININENMSADAIKSSTRRLITNAKSVTDTRKITAYVSVTYSLPTTQNNLLYNYVVKRNDSFKSQTERPSSDSNFTTVGFSNLPISYNASTTTSYNLTLSNIKFGDNGKYSPTEYTCNYNVTKALPSDCLCPPGTKYSGKDLSDMMIEENKTCYQAQAEYCETDHNACPDGSKSSEMADCMSRYNDYFTCYDQNCRTTDNNKFCPNDSTINLTACLNNLSYSECVNLLCNDNNNGDGYHCRNTNGVDGPMDITSCVYTKMSQGLSRDDAINACDSLICPLSGLRIIYRTISLENPFPSKTADAIITQQNLRVGMFNDNVKGRYPGTNWNDTNLVQKHILTVTRNNQTIDGSDIYKNEPLYRFELDTTKIKEIREYNKTRVENGGYADFTLECRLNNARACVSNFVHDPDKSGLVSGLCMNSTSNYNFYQCSGDI